MNEYSSILECDVAAKTPFRIHGIGILQVSSYSKDDFCWCSLGASCLLLAHQVLSSCLPVVTVLRGIHDVYECAHLCIRIPSPYPAHLTLSNCAYVT